MRTLAIAMLCFACSEAAIKDSDPSVSPYSEASSETNPPFSKDSPPSSAESRPDGESEAASPPAQINGSYLHCIQLLELNPNQPVALAGCRFETEEGKRVPLNTIAKGAEFSLGAMSDPTVTGILRKTKSKDAAYDALLDLNAPTGAAVIAAMSSLRVNVALTGLVSGAPDTLLSTLPSQELAAPVGADIDANWTSKCNELGCDYLDIRTGLNWTAFNGDLKTFDEAVDQCALYAANDVSDTWRLPTLAEVLLVRSNQVANSRFAGDMDIRSGQVWSTTSNPSAPVPANLTASLQLLDQSPQSTERSVRIGWHCVRD